MGEAYVKSIESLCISKLGHNAAIIGAGLQVFKSKTTAFGAREVIKDGK